MAEIERILTLYGMETPDLIHQYHLERLNEQNQIEKSTDGLMAITLQRDNNQLHIEILNAQNIRQMDSNGKHLQYSNSKLDKNCEQNRSRK